MILKHFDCKCLWRIFLIMFNSFFRFWSTALIHQFFFSIDINLKITNTFCTNLVIKLLILRYVYLKCWLYIVSKLQKKYDGLTIFVMNFNDLYSLTIFSDDLSICYIHKFQLYQIIYFIILFIYLIKCIKII